MAPGASIALTNCQTCQTRRKDFANKNTQVLLFAAEELFDIVDADDIDNHSKRDTLVFNTFVFLQLVNQINARKLRGSVDPILARCGTQSWPDVGPNPGQMWSGPHTHIADRHASVQNLRVPTTHRSDQCMQVPL